MTLEQRLQNALQAKEPAIALRSLVLELFQAGHAKAEIYGLLEQLVLQQRKQPGFRESDEDLVLDIMDSLTGWCHPQAELLAKDESAKASGEEFGDKIAQRGQTVRQV